MSAAIRMSTAILVIATITACYKADPRNRSTVPGVTLVTPISTQRGDVTISYVLFDAESNPVSILVEFSLDGGVSYAIATAGAGGDGIAGLASSPAGTPHTYVWDSFADGAGDPTLILDARIRITPSDTASGLPVETMDFRVHNGIVTAYRLTSLALRDPHVFATLPIFGCTDITDSAPLGQPGLNESIQTELTTDGDMDGFIDLSLLILFRQLEPVGTNSMVEFALGECTVAGPSCDLAPGGISNAGTYSSTATGPCLTPVGGTTFGYTPSITTPTTPCFTSQPFDLDLPLAGGLTIRLQSAQLGATLVGSPVTSLSNGLLMGFLPEADAAAVSLTTPIGPVVLSSLFKGGAGACAAGDDRDLGPDGTTLGWWIYVNFTADLATYTGP